MNMNNESKKSANLEALVELDDNQLDTIAGGSDPAFDSGFSSGRSGGRAVGQGIYDGLYNIGKAEVTAAGAVAGFFDGLFGG